ncbi:transposable element Tcb2 transposase [Trichonephila clavipes]|nr:transposable element Tcb2 transposase [Trichonephila clavipes]
MDKASSHTSKSNASYLPKNESEIGIKRIPFDEIRVKSPYASAMSLCFWFIKTSLRKTASKNAEGNLENGLRGMEKIPRREDRGIVRQALVDPTVTRSTIRADVGVAIVPQTTSRHLAETNIKSKRPFRALPLTPKHRQLRLQWCQARSMWNVTDWQKVVFSDESRFVLGTEDNRVRVWRRPGERYN